MEKNRIVPLIYGYVVCLVSIIVGLISISMLIGAIFSLQDPLRTNDFRYGGPANLTSFEAYKIDALTGRGILSPETRPANPPEAAATYQPTEAELRAAYEAAKEDRIASVRLQATREITNAVLLLVVGGILFTTHWRWVNRLTK
jgi:hypothetical protein